MTAHAPHRARALRGRVGGFALTSWAALEDDPGLARAVRPRRRARPARRARCSTIRRARAGPTWRGVTPELDFALRIHEWDFALRDPLTAVYRALRAAGVRER